MKILWLSLIVLTVALGASAGDLNLKHAVLVADGDVDLLGACPEVLAEELHSRTGIRLKLATGPGSEKSNAIILRVSHALAAEEYQIEAGEGRPWQIRVEGGSRRGLLFGVGRLLREMDWKRGKATVPADLAIRSKPVYAVRGHQLGYRATANSYDAWDESQYDQYIRDLALFGCNAIENIPGHGEKSPLMAVSPEQMNVAISRICQKYDIDYWLWTPASFDLNDQDKRAEALHRHEEMYKALPHLNNVFVPGGDPGDNPPGLVMAFLKDLKDILSQYHPEAGVWMSLQGFDQQRVDEFFDLVNKENPEWFAGVVGGPQSPSLSDLRRRLPARYRLVDYPDITHTVLCQYPVPWWDPALALTLGREPVNPRPRDYAQIHAWTAPWTDGFVSYSDGMHDDANKVLWNVLGWDPSISPREALRDYAGLFFSPALADDAADALLALESNWSGPLALNGSVEGTYRTWQALSERVAGLMENWRFRLHLFRAQYDAFTRRRLLYEARLEQEANVVLAKAPGVGADVAMAEALAILRRADTAPCCPEMVASLEEHGEALFRLIGYQTSVERYGASNFERGAVLDFLARPLNNRWWLEDQFAAIGAMQNETEKLQRLELITTWESPGPSSIYDDIGNVAKSSSVVRGKIVDSAEAYKIGGVSFSTHIDKGKSRWRLSWLSYMDWPDALVYEPVDPGGSYVLRLTGRGDALPRAEGIKLSADVYSKEIGEFKEFLIPAQALSDGRLVITFDVPEEEGVNWRYSSMLTDAWLIRR